MGDLAILYLGCVEHWYAPKNRHVPPKGAEVSLLAECRGRVVRVLEKKNFPRIVSFSVGLTEQGSPLV